MSGVDRISALHDDLLLKILSQVPTMNAVTTMVLSKRWRFVWTMVPKLEYNDTRIKGDKRFCCLIDKSLQLHKAPVLESLRIQIYHDQFFNDADVGKYVSYAVDHSIRKLALRVLSPTQILLLPPNVYTSKTLVKLTLACRTLVVDVPSLPCLPSLQRLSLVNVVYKDENSHVRLLANCPALSKLYVHRNTCDNVTTFIVKVPSLKRFTYSQQSRSSSRSLVLDSPGLQSLSLGDMYGDLDGLHNMPHLDWADVSHFFPYPNDNKFLRSFSYVKVLHLSLRNDACYSVINFPRLVKLTLRPCGSNFSKCSLELVMLFLHSSPILKELTIIYDVGKRSNHLPFSWNQQSSVPECLLSHLEIFVWEKFGRRRQERDFVEYILANSKCLKTARVSPRCSYSLEEKEKMVEDLQSMYRVSASSQLKTQSASTNPGRATA